MIVFYFLFCLLVLICYLISVLRAGFWIVTGPSS